MTNFAVLGTDTGVGKTVVTAGIVGRLREAGHDARAVKPVQTGYPPDDDARVIQAACGDGTPESEAATCLRRLQPPLAPAVAAERDGVELDYQRLLEDCADHLAEAPIGILEGIGGIRVPLIDDKEVIDLVADLDLSAVLVARAGLGTLNHTALSVEALDRRGIPVESIILNNDEGASVAERTNPEMVESMTNRTVHTLPAIDTAESTEVVAAIREHLPRVVPSQSGASSVSK